MILSEGQWDLVNGLDLNLYVDNGDGYDVVSNLAYLHTNLLQR